MRIEQVNKQTLQIASDFITNVFVDYYNDLIGNKQATYMADLFLSKQAIEKLMDLGAIFKMVIDNEEIVGFTEYIKEDNKVFLSKLYVRKDRRHTGIGKMMLDDCIEYTKANNLHTIYLTVNKGNTHSIDVYDHIGFVRVDSVVNDIGNGYVMDDYIMELTI